MKTGHIILLALLGGSRAILAAAEYNIVNLAVGLADHHVTAALGVNNLGQAVGWIGQLDLSRTPFLYTDEAGAQDFGSLGTPWTYAADINDRGQIAASGTLDGGSQVLRYSPGVGWEQLTHQENAYLFPSRINGSGQIAGTIDYGAGTGDAFRYTDGRGVLNLGSLGAISANDINDQGALTGQTAEGHAYIYQDGSGMTDLGEGEGKAINNAGVVAGQDASRQAVLFIGGQEMTLGQFQVEGLNNLNQVVGFALGDEFEPLHAYLWSDAGGLQDLNTLIPADSGWALNWASDINDKGQIVGLGNYNGKETAFRLDPLPRLSIQAAGTNVVVSWQPAWPDAVLQATANLSGSDWQTVPTSGTNLVSLPAAEAARFFRVVRP